MAEFNPTGLEQEMLELVNRMRLDPAAELSLLVNNLDPITSPDPDVQNALEFFNVDGNLLASQWSDLTPVAPLAWSENLYNAAFDHSEKMIEFDEQSHQLPGEPELSERVINAGYNWSQVSESLFAFSESVFFGHAGLAIDWGFGTGGIQEPPGHRNNIMNTNSREIGIAILPENDPNTDVGPLVITQNFGNRPDFGSPWLLGVVFNDIDEDNFYDNGEGLGDVNVSVSGSNGTFDTTTMTAGGYQIQVPSGDYTVTFSGGSLSSPIVQSVEVGSENAKLDANVNLVGNNLPLANNDTAITQAETAIAIAVLNNDTDSDGTLDLTSVTATQPTNGTVAVNPTNGVITYTPNANFTGTDSFTYTVDDNEGETSNAATVEVTVDADVANVAPVATNDTATTAENTAIAIAVLNNDTDSDGTLDLTSVTATQPTNGTVAVNPTNGVITYTPNANFTGTDSFTYTVDDNEGETSNPATVKVTVNADVANVAPVATNDTATTNEGEAVTINILNNDTDSDGTLDVTSITLVTQPSDGNLQINSTTGVVTYTPDANFTGNDTFTYTVADNDGENSNPATVNITVNPVEEVPPSLTLEDDNIFSFGSNATEEVSLKFTLDIPTGVDAANTNEIGVVEVDSDGNIIPGTEQVIFSTLNNDAQDFLAEKGFFGNSFSQILTGLSGDSRLVFYLVPNSTTEAVGNITRSNSNVIFGSTFGVANASEQLEVSELGNGSFELSFEDIVGGDPQGESFGDLVVNVELTDEEFLGTDLQGEKELIDLSDFGGEQFSTEIIATANAGFNNEGGLYIVQDSSGTVLDPLTGSEISPNDPGYAAAALRNSVVEFDKIDPDPFLLAGGFIYAPYMKADGSEEQVYFAFSEANPGESQGVDHVRSIGSNAFAFEDLLGGGDLSYDDFIFEVSLEPVA